MIETTDMYLAAALLSYDANYLGTNKEDMNRQKFQFGDDIEVPKIFIVRNGVPETIADPTFEEFRNYFDSFKLLYLPDYPQSLKKLKTIIHR